MSSGHFKFDLHCAAGQEAANFLQQVASFQEAALPAAELFTSRCSNDYLAPVLPPILFAELCQSKLFWKTKPFSLNKIGRHFTLKSCHRWNNKSKIGFSIINVILYCRAVSLSQIRVFDKCDNLSPKDQRRLYLSKISPIFVCCHFKIIFKFHVFISNNFF